MNEPMTVSEVLEYLERIKRGISAVNGLINGDGAISIYPEEAVEIETCLNKFEKILKNACVVLN